MLPYRQIHLDFHTSPLIPDVGKDFNAEEFARVLSDAKVQLINIFGKCHHGYAYYPSKVGPVHPSLKFDLLGAQIEALHKKGIRCPVYTTLVWDEYAAETHPEWLQLDENGRQVGRGPFEKMGWKFLCLNSGYIDYFAAQVDEILQYNPDGFWFDIVKYNDSGCSCPACMASMKKKGYDPSKGEDRERHSIEAARQVMDRLSRQVHAKCPSASVVFNCRQRIDDRPWYSFRNEIPYCTQIDIESLPSGGWGYNHFPVFSRYNRMFGRETVGMNGRFHKSWADFGGMKNQAALEYECFSMLAMGARVNVGDQLHPRGKLDAGVYELIGRVFRQIEAKEPWCRDARPAAEIALMAVNDPPVEGKHNPGITHLEAAAQMLVEQGAQFAIIDWEENFDDFRLVIFPDVAVFDERKAEKVKAYIDKGGKALLTGRSGLGPGGDRFALDLGFGVEGESPYTATYLRVGDALGKDLLKTDYVSYERGINLVPGPSSEILAQAVAPYFERDWNHFMSHQQTPPDKLSPYAGALRNGNVICFSDPLFISYKKHGNRVYKQLVAGAVSLLLGRRMIESDLPSTAKITVCDQDSRRVVHILHYPAERRAGIDIIEEAIPLYNKNIEALCGFKPGKVYFAPSGEPAGFTYEGGTAFIRVPEINGHQMVVLEK